MFYNIPHIIGRQSLTTRTASSYSMRIKTTLPLCNKNWNKL